MDRVRLMHYRERRWRGTPSSVSSNLWRYAAPPTVTLCPQSQLVIAVIYFCCVWILAESVRNVNGMSLTRNAAAVTATAPQMNNHQNISNLLDSLLRGYDNSIRPGFGGPPAVVEVDIMVRSMGPISEVDMTYSMDCYFRQSWVDRRLAFPGDEHDTLALSISMLSRIWKPDTYFYNGKQSYLHTITTPNKFVRLYRDGRVLYSSRLTIKAGCPMNLEDFPMDIQRCPLKFGSFGYTSQDLLYHWNDARQVAIAEDMKLSQFDLIATPSANHTDTITSNDKMSAEYSMLLVSFHLQRHMGNFLIQVYGPCVLLVVLSWVSFWLNREATADRVSLGITTVLTMTFLGLEARTDLPKVPYPTALDFFVFLSFAFIFATIIQFAVVHYFTKYGSGECYFSMDFYSETSDSSDDENEESVTNRKVNKSDGTVTCQESTKILTFNTATTHSGPPEHIIEVIPLTSCTIPRATPSRNRSFQIWPGLPSCLKKCTDDSMENEILNGHQMSAIQKNSVNSVIGQKRLSFQTTKVKKQRKMRRMPRFNSVSKIDRASRVFFPLLFLAINVFYWYNYLSRSERISAT